MGFDPSHYSVDSTGKIYGHQDVNLQDFVPEIPGDSSHLVGHLSFGGLLNPIPGDVVQMAKDVSESWRIHNSSPESYELNSFAHLWTAAYMSYKYGDSNHDKEVDTMDFTFEVVANRNLLKHSSNLIVKIGDS